MSLETTAFSVSKFNSPPLSLRYGKETKFWLFFQYGGGKNVHSSDNNIETIITINIPVTYKSVDITDKNTIQFNSYCMEEKVANA